MSSRRSAVKAIESEYEGASFEDARLTKRAPRIAGQWAADPTASIPQLAPDDAELEATYRFLGNTKVTPRRILAPHVAATARRAKECGTIRVAHDTTDFVFSGDREGLGAVMRETKGFFLHPALAVSGDEDAMPLGVLAFKEYTRADARVAELNARKLAVRKTPRKQKESARWEEVAFAAQDALPPEVRAIHVMDQEADDYVLLAALVSRGLSFVVRGSADRLLEPRGESVAEALTGRQIRIFREIPVEARKRDRSEKNRKSHPPRSAHVAKLSVRATQIVLHRPQHAVCDVESLSLNVVQVLERNPPEGEDPITWTLFTSEPIKTAKDIAAIVDHYRARWKIEEFFKALKTGCAVQARQLTSLHALSNALALSIPIAWRLLLLRSLARRDDETPASGIFKPWQLRLLRAISRRVVVPEKPTVRDVLLAIAGLGGHLRRNGEPGWIVLSRGFSAFVSAEATWIAMKSA